MAVPFVLVTMAVGWWVSMWGSMMLTVIGLGVFGFAVTRPMGRVLAHTMCAFCSRKILFEHEGEICPSCNEGVHGTCIAEHKMKSHAPTTDQPFR